MATSTLVQETGSGSATANSYATAAQLDQWAEDRNVTLSGTYGDQTQVLYKAMDYLENLEFIGHKYTQTQALQWPRYGVMVDGFDVDSDAIPQELVDAQLTIALAIDQNYDPLAKVNRKQDKLKVDVIEIMYSDSSASNNYDPAIIAQLRKLLKPGTGGSNTFGVFS